MAKEKTEKEEKTVKTAEAKLPNKTAEAKHLHKTEEAKTEEKKAVETKEKTPALQNKEESKKPKKAEKPVILKESVHTINLSSAFKSRTRKRSRTALNFIRKYAGRSSTKRVVLSPAVSDALFARGITKPPRTIKVKLQEEKDRLFVALQV